MFALDVAVVAVGSGTRLVVVCSTVVTTVVAGAVVVVSVVVVVVVVVVVSWAPASIAPARKRPATKRTARPVTFSVLATARRVEIVERDPLTQKSMSRTPDVSSGPRRQPLWRPIPSITSATPSASRVEGICVRTMIPMTVAVAGRSDTASA